VVSPDGQLVASAHADYVVVIRSLTSGEELGRIQVDGAVLSLAFAGDSMTLYVADRTGKVTSWSTTGRPVATVMNVGKNLDVSYLTKAGELLVALAEGTDNLTVHLCRNGSNVYWGKYSRYKSAWSEQAPLVAMHNDSNRLVSASGDTVTVLNAASPDDPQSYLLTEESTRRVGCIAISDDGQVVAAAETTDFEKGMPRRNELELTKGFRIKAWNLADGHELCSFIGHELSVNLIAISHDRTRLATASRDETIKIWNVENPAEPIATFHGQTAFTALTFDSDGKHVLAGDDKGTVRIWELSSADTSLVLEGKGEIGEVVFINGGERIVGGSNVWDSANGQRLATLGFEPTRGRDQRRIAVTADDKLVSGGSNLVDLSSCAPLPGYLRSNWPLDVAFDPASTKIATAEESLEVYLAEFATGKEIRRFSFPQDTEQKTLWATSVAFSPNGDAILGASGGTDPHHPGQVNLWNLKTGELLREFKGHGKSVWRVVFDPEGNRIAAATGNYLLTDVDNEVWVWDAHTGEVRHVLKGHRECVFDVDFSPDGTRLASVSGLIRSRGRPNDSPGELKLWDLQTGQELLKIENANAGLVSVAFDQSGKQIAVGATNGKVTVFRPSFLP
jgi:WD40 repeat protein